MLHVPWLTLRELFREMHCNCSSKSIVTSALGTVPIRGFSQSALHTSSQRGLLHVHWIECCNERVVS